MKFPKLNAFAWGLPLLAVAELCAHLAFARRAPEPEDYLVLRPVLERLKQPGDMVVTAPHWADPLVRSALGDELMPLAEVARPDDSLFKRALEVGILGKTAPELEGWKVLDESSHGAFRVRVLQNPDFVQPLYRFVDQLGPGQAEVFVEEAHGHRTRSCLFTEHARPRTGGLHGAIAFPRARFRCSGAEHQFVGVTVMDDQDYRPRRCIWAHPSDRGPLVLRFDRVPLNKEIFGYAGLSYFLMREGAGTPVVLEVRIDGKSIGRYVHRDEWGWAPFHFPLPRSYDEPSSVEFVVTSERADYRHFCFYADSR